MNLTGLELKKILKSSMTAAAIILIFTFNIFNFACTGNSNYAPAGENSAVHIQTAKENGAYFKGAITDRWTKKFTEEIKAFRSDPANMVSEEEAEKILEEMKTNGYDEDYIRENMQILFLREDVMTSEEYNKYEPVEFSMRFYEFAAYFGETYAENFRLTFPGKKGETLAEAALNDYSKLAEEYIAYYNYDIGYQWMSNMVISYNVTLGVLMIIALSGIFCTEYTHKTDSLILSAKYGKRTLAAAKVRAGLIFSVAGWAILTIVNLGLTTYYYGWEGWEAFWQDWAIHVAPFCWNQGIALTAAIATSFIGTVYFALVIMAVSAISRNQIVSILICFGLLVIPSMDLGTAGISWLYSIFAVMPATVMRGELIWRSYRPVYLFGNVAAGQYIILIIAVVISILSAFIAVKRFKNHQVSN